MSTTVNRKEIINRAISMGQDLGKIDIIKLANNYGVRVFEEQMSQDESGYIVYNDEKKEFCITVNSEHSKERQRFSIAHEFAHFVLHNYKVRRLKRVDRDNVQSLPKKQEEEADNLAAEILMPEVLVYGFMDTLPATKDSVISKEVVWKVSKKFKVSILAAIVRLRNLDYYVPYLQFI